MRLSTPLATRTCVALLALAVLGGCSGESETPRVAVEGQVRLDGKPLAAGLVRFIPQEQGRGALAEIHQGRFQLDAQSGPSAGAFQIVISPQVPELPQAMEAIKAGSADPLNMRQVPLRYQTPGQLSATIQPASQGNPPLQFDLSSR